MSSDLVYEIARFDSEEDGALLCERLQLFSVDGALLLRNADDSETRCESADIAAVISSTPSLREIRAGEATHISCSPEIVAELPFVLDPMRPGGASDSCYAKVNGADWMAFPTAEGEHVMLPGCEESEGPDMSPCWAEQTLEEGEWNPLIGITSIGLLSPGVALEFGRCDPGGLGVESAVAIRPFDDFSTVFVDWLMNWEVLSGVWYGDSPPYAPTVQLFEIAAEAANHQASWDAEIDELEDEDEDDDDEHGESCSASAHLTLHLSDELIDMIRARLSKSER